MNEYIYYYFYYYHHILFVSWLYWFLLYQVLLFYFTLLSELSPCLKMHARSVHIAWFDVWTMVVVMVSSEMRWSLAFKSLDGLACNVSCWKYELAQYVTRFEVTVVTATRRVWVIRRNQQHVVIVGQTDLDSCTDDCPFLTRLQAATDWISPVKLFEMWWHL